MRTIHTLALFGFLAVLSSTLVLASQVQRGKFNIELEQARLGISSTPSQQTVNALSQQRIEQLEARISADKSVIEDMRIEVDELKTSQARLIGIGIGLVAGLTALQGLLVIITFRNSGKKEGK